MCLPAHAWQLQTQRTPTTPQLLKADANHNVSAATTPVLMLYNTSTHRKQINSWKSMVYTFSNGSLFTTAPQPPRSPSQPQLPQQRPQP